MKTLKVIKVLVVEDDPVALEALTAYFKLLGHDVSSAGSGLGALVMMEAFSPHVIIVDHRMPFVSGIEFIKQIKAKDRWKDTPVVLITALPDGPELDELREDISRLQPARLLRKPFDLPALMATIREMPRAPGLDG